MTQQFYELVGKTVEPCDKYAFFVFPNFTGVIDPSWLNKMTKIRSSISLVVVCRCETFVKMLTKTYLKSSYLPTYLPNYLCDSSDSNYISDQTKFHKKKNLFSHKIYIYINYQTSIFFGKKNFYLFFKSFYTKKFGGKKNLRKKLKLWQNPNNSFVRKSRNSKGTKLKSSSCEKTKQFKCLQDATTNIMTKLKN